MNKLFLTLAILGFCIGLEANDSWKTEPIIREYTEEYSGKVKRDSNGDRI